MKELITLGHTVYIETQAGAGIGFQDQDYIQAGGEILPTPADIFAESEMIVKVKEPQASERLLLPREPNIIHLTFTFALSPLQTQ
ncbi:hypothetical protein [Photobacterium leiognathi]|uniref:hypothetical protein n=1 Tax=Photobacterium leiognathi TaxID=553611 RepID=UPI002739DB27|nr:hypothetical protein [Photobacterium leiognathi]